MKYEQIQDTLSNPSPITLINVFNPSSNDKNVKEVKAVVDTGSGKTCLPQDVITTLQELGNLEVTTYDVIPIEGKRLIAQKFYRVSLELQNGKLHEIEVYGIPRDYAIIGRDILNKYRVVLDAPSEQWGFKCRWIDGETCGGDNCILPISSQNL